MKPQTIGRTLGIGFRVAGRIAAQRIAGPGVPVTASGKAVAASQQAASVGHAVGRTSGGVARGIKGFLRPFGRVGGTLWLEVVGVFFLLPVIVFGPRMWQTRASWDHGPDHRTFVASAILVLIFLYLGVSSFWRAHRRSAAK